MLELEAARLLDDFLQAVRERDRLVVGLGAAAAGLEAAGLDAAGLDAAGLDAAPAETQSHK